MMMLPHKTANTRDAFRTPPPDVGPATPPAVTPAAPPGVQGASATPPAVSPPTPAGVQGVSATHNDAEAEPQPFALRPRRMLRSGAGKALNDRFLALCDEYLAGNRPRTVQASAKAAFKRYDDGHLTARQLADFMSAFYEAMSDHQDASQEQVAWLSDEERKTDHWRKLGYAEYDDYLAAIDPYGKARAMIKMHSQTVRRKTTAICTVRECWAGSPELQELVTASEGEGKWMSLAGLAKATDGAPEVAKHCLNQAILTRLRSAKTKRGATKAFTSLDFMAAKKHAGTIDWAARPEVEYQGILGPGMKLYRGIVLPKTRYPGKEDRRRARARPNDIQEPLTADNLAALDAGSSSAAPPVHQATSVSSLSALSSAPSRLATPSCERDSFERDIIPPHELVEGAPASADQPTGGSSSSQGRTVPPPTPVSLQRPRTLAAGPATANDEGPIEDGTPSPSVPPCPHRKEQAAFRTKFGITDPELSPKSSLLFDAILEEVTGGKGQEWINKKEIHLQGCFDWLLKDDKEVVDMLSYERKLIRYHNNGKEPYDFPLSLAHQAARQDPGMYLIAAACLGNSRVVAVPFRGEGSLFVELELDKYTGNTRVACQLSAPGGRRLSLIWAGLSENGSCIEDSSKSSWGRYVVGHAHSVSEAADSVQVCIFYLVSRYMRSEARAVGLQRSGSQCERPGIGYALPASMVNSARLPKCSRRYCLRPRIGTRLHPANQRGHPSPVEDCIPRTSGVGTVSPSELFLLCYSGREAAS